jgi:hypothetical protein
MAVGDVEVPANGHEGELELLLGSQEIENTAVYPVIHSIRQDIIVRSSSIYLSPAKA